METLIKWVSVDERLPAYAVVVLTVDNKGIIAECWRVKTDQAGDHWRLKYPDDADPEDLDWFDIKYWAQKPEFPDLKE